MQHQSALKLTKYEPSFDGLRALAVMSVIVYHVSSKLIPGGWMGVDVFFVLSGYLITSLLSREIESHGGIEFRNFYVRRFLRLTPAFWVLLTFCALVIVLLSPNKTDNLRSVLISGLYMMNWNRAFDLFPQWYLGHTWSLAMEEQFYLLWPLTLLFIVHRQPLRWIMVMIVTITTWRFYLAFLGADPERTYNGFDTHGDALLIGCVLALLPISTQFAVRAKTLIAIPIIAAILMLGGAAHRTLFTQTIGLTLASLISAWLILGCLQPSLLRRALSIRPLVYTGRISYGWYLWHYPILLLGEKISLFQNKWGKVALVLIGYAVAVCSYRLIEQPFLRLKLRFEPRKTISKPLNGMVLVMPSREGSEPAI